MSSDLRIQPALRVPDLTWLATDDLHTHGERLNDSNVLDPRACEVQRKAVDNSAVAFLYKALRRCAPVRPHAPALSQINKVAAKPERTTRSLSARKGRDV